MRLGLTAFIFLATIRCAQAETVPLGVVFKGEQILLELNYTNSGKAAIHIAQVSSSCDCTQTVQGTTEVQAGAAIKIPLVYNADNVGKVVVTVRLIGDQPSGDIKTYTVAGFVADRSWFVSSREAQGEGFTLVDTRRLDQYSELHIARAINIPVFALKTKSYLRGKKLVLVDDGVAPTDLLSEVITLRQQGFAQVFILRGGLPAWIRDGGKVEGSTNSALAVTRIPAAEFACASRFAKWQVVEIGDTFTPVAEAVNVISISETADVSKELISLTKESDANQGIPPNILIIAPTNASHAKIEAHLGLAAQLPVFYLEGGIKALASFHVEQVEAASNTGRRIKNTTARGVPIVAGGCSSCGK